MLIIRKNQTNNLIATVSMNKTLANPYYLFSFQHITSKERVSFIPQVITSNVRYDKFRFVEAPTTNLSTTPPQVYFQYLGQYYYSIYEQVSSGNTDPSLAYNKLESGRANVIVGNDNLIDCIFEPYISNDEDFAQVIYVAEDEQDCINPTPSVTPSSTLTPTPSVTPTLTPTNTITISVTPSLTPTNTETPSSTPTLTPTPSSTPAPAFDPDAAAYLSDVLTAGGTLDATISAATDVLFTSLKSNSLYDKMFAFYPMVGGTANSIGIQGKRSSGTTYDMQWFGGWSYGTSGATGNGVNSYATFNISGGTLLATNSHLALYGNLANVFTAGYDLSINFNNQVGKVQQIILEFNGGGLGYYEYNGYAGVAGSDTANFAIFSRNAAGTDTIRARNGIALADKTESCLDIDNTRQWILGAENFGNGAVGPSTSNRYCWVGFGYKLTAAELLTYQSIINTFETSLGRNIY